MNQFPGNIFRVGSRIFAQVIKVGPGTKFDNSGALYRTDNNSSRYLPSGTLSKASLAGDKALITVDLRTPADEKVLPKIKTDVAMTTQELSLSELNTFIPDKGYKGAFLFLGHGSKGQFNDVNEMERAVDQVVGEFNIEYGIGKWLLVFGGDPAKVEKPDIGYLVKRVKEKYPEVPILAVQADEYKKWGVGGHVDYVYYYPTQKNAQGSIVYGGYDEATGELLGSSKFYLSQAFIKSGLKGIVSFGGGDIARDEVKYALKNGLNVIAYHIAPRFEPASGEKFGILDGWLDTQSNQDNLQRRTVPDQAMTANLPNWAKIAIGVGAVSAFAILSGSFIKHKLDQGKQYERSKSRANMEALAHAIESNDVNALMDIARIARDRHARMTNEIAQAIASHSDHVNNVTKDPLRKAQAYAAYDSFVEAAAVLGENKLNASSTNRIGGLTLNAWRARFDVLVKGSQKTGHEGQVLGAINELRKNVSKLRAGADKIEGEIKNFDALAPFLFGKTMAKDIAGARALLNDLRTGEIDGKDNLAKEAMDKTRQRISDRLQASDSTFAQHVSSRDQFEAVIEKDLGPVAKLANDIHSGLLSVADLRETEDQKKREASYHTSDMESSMDMKGHVSLKSVDNSGPYIRAADEARDDAESLARKLHDSTLDLHQRLPGLGTNTVLIDMEYIAQATNVFSKISLEEGALPYGYNSVDLRAYAAGISSQMSEGQARRAAETFSPVSTELGSMASKLQNRIDTEKAAIEEAINNVIKTELELKPDQSMLGQMQDYERLISEISANISSWRPKNYPPGVVPHLDSIRP